MKKLLLVLVTLIFSLPTLAESDKSTVENFKKSEQVKEFFENNKESFSPELESILIKKAKNIRTKNTLGQVVGWSSYITGGIIMFDAVLAGQDENGKYDTSTALKGFGIAALGMVIKELIRPKNRHYYDFINTVNRENNKKINIEVTMNYHRNLNFGLALNF